MAAAKTATPEAAPIQAPPAPAQPVQSPPAAPRARGDAIPLQHPTYAPDIASTPQEHLRCCGNCKGWKRSHMAAPFGQCLPAMRFLGAPMYTPDLGNCTMDDEAIDRAMQRR